MVTSIISGPMIQRILKRRKPSRFTDYLGAKAFLNPLQVQDRVGAIKELTQTICVLSNLDAKSVEAAIWFGELIMPTGLSNGVAVPHARIEGLSAPVVGVGLSRTGIDFKAADGEPAHIIFLILTPRNDDGVQLEILADIARTFSNAETREKALEVANYTEFLTLLKIEGASAGGQLRERIEISKNN